MTKARTALGLVVAVCVFYTMRCAVLPRVLPPGEIEYRGETIQLARWYFNYEDYESDVDQLDPKEVTRVARLVTSAPVVAAPRDRREMVTSVSEIAFPGFGWSSFGDRVQPNGSTLSGFSVEIPMVDQERVLVFERTSSGIRLIDDFVAPSQPFLRRVELDETELVYSTRSGAQVTRRPYEPERVEAPTAQ